MRVVIVSILALAVMSEVRGEERRALLVGVSTYRKTGFADKPLPFASSDMETLAKELTAGGWKVTTLISRGSTNTAGRADIVAGLDKLLDGIDADDLVLVALSGHGQQFRAKVAADDGLVEQEEAFFCPSDGVAGQPATLFGMTELLRQLGKKGGRNLVLVDACRDDPRRGGKGVEGNTARNVPGNTSVLFSCAARQQSFETNQMFPKGSTSGHGVFFHRVLKGLRGEAVNDRGEVSWTRLVEYVCEHVNDDAVGWFPERAIETPGGKKLAQTPHVISSLIGRAPVLAGEDAEGKYRLGVRLLLAQGGREENRRALACLRTASELNHAAATCWLAVMQDHGFDFTPIDKPGVRLRLKLAAAGGYAPAQALMGMDYVTGDVDLMKDEALGRRLLATAITDLGLLAEHGDALAQFCLGAMNDDGLGLPKNAVEAVRRYRLAADLGLAVAQNNLGLMHEEGRGVPKDIGEAETCYRRAARQGSAAAQFNLATVLEQRRSARDEALVWLRRAALQGHAEARAELQRRKIDP